MFVLEGIWSCHKNALRCEALRLEPQVRAEKTISYKSNGGAGDTKELLKQAPLREMRVIEGQDAIVVSPRRDLPSA
jgi:hypothetical protein